MSIKLTPEVFKWLQSLQLVKQAKRNNQFLQLPEDVSLKFFDGKLFATVLKSSFSQSLDEEAMKKLQTLKDNSNPAIRLYNWNILTEVLKRAKLITLDAAQKSKILNLDAQPILKILKNLYELRAKPSQQQKKGLKVEISQLSKKSLHQSANAMQFLIISLSKNFKLSPQHTVNLFLDNNKYLSHLLVKGVKNSFGPIYDFLNELKSNVEYLVSHVFFIDEQENIQFFFNAIKSCVISKDEMTVVECLDVWGDVVMEYKMKGLGMTNLKGWMKNEGVNTLFYALKKEPSLFERIIELCYACLDTQLFQFFAMSEKNLLWDNDRQKLSVFRKLITLEQRDIVDNFLKSTMIEQWLKHLNKYSKRCKQLEEIYDVNVVFESLWLLMGDGFQDERMNLVGGYLSFVRQSLSLKHHLIFTSVMVSVFNLIKVLGLKKNTNAPQLFKLAISAFSNISTEDEERMSFMCGNMSCTIKEIKNLPGGALVGVIVKHLSAETVNLGVLQLCRTILTQKRVNEQQSVELLDILTKIIFQNNFSSSLALDIVFQFLLSTNDEMADQYLVSSCRLALASFVSHAKTFNKTLKQLRPQVEQEAKTYSQTDNPKGKQLLISNLSKHLLIHNSIQFLSKYLQINDINLRNSLQIMLFHTYVKVKVELKKKKVADYLLPLLRVYYDNDDQLQEQILEFEKQQFPEGQEKDSTTKATLLKSMKRANSLQTSQAQQVELKTIDPSSLKPSQFALKDLQSIKQKREHLKTIQLQRQKQSLQSSQKLQQIKSLMNEKRLIEFGSNGKSDFEYKGLYEFDSIKQEEVVSGVPAIRLVSFDKQEEIPYEDDLRNIIKKYRKVWRFLFFKYSTFGAKKQQFKTQQKIHMAEIWKMVKQYELFPLLKKEESQMIIKLINDAMKRKNDPQSLTYQGFEEYIIQLCVYAYGKSAYPHVPPGRQVLLLIEQVKKTTKQRGGSVQLFENPEDIYFQQTEVIREYNRRLKYNPDYILPEGYKKYKLSSLSYDYSVHPILQRNIRQSYVDVYEVLHEILYEKIGVSLIEPLSIKSEVTLAKPVLFQNITEKMKEYKRGYLQPKVTIEGKQERARSLRKSIVIKKEFKPHINFSLGIKLGLSSVSVKNKTIAEQVAYWMHDMLNAIESESLRVQNTARKRVQNTIIRRRRVESLQKLRKQKSGKKEWKKRAESVKVRLEMLKRVKQQQSVKKKQVQLEEKRRKRARQQQSLKKKLSRFEEMKRVMGEKRQEAKYKQLEEQDRKKQRLQEYKQKVAEYFEKKKGEILNKQQQLKRIKQQHQKAQQQKKKQQEQFVKNLYINNLKKEETLLQKAQQIKEEYDELWSSEQIKQEFKKYETQTGLLFQLLLKYEKSKISQTTFDQIALGTLHFFALKFMLIPFMVEKNDLVKIYNFILKEKQKRQQKQSNINEDIQILQTKKGKTSGLSFNNFQQALFLISIKAKKLLNEIKQKRRKRLQKLAELVKEKKVTKDEDFDLQDLDDQQDQQQEEQEEQQQEQKVPGLLDQYLYNVEGVDEETLRQVFVFLRLPRDKLGMDERYRAVVESKNNKPKNILIRQLKEQMLNVKIKDLQIQGIDVNQQEDEKD